jgi:sugar/nucleoside kinase (ribokinase family)
MAQRAKPQDPVVVGVGINATDTIIRLPRFPVFDSKIEFLSAQVMAGGQVASAMVACRRWGLRARYVGKIGGDAAGKLQRKEMAREGVDAHWIVVKNSMSQSAYILVDEPSGERTILWKRDASIALRPADLNRKWIAGAEILLVDGHDTVAATRVARWARQQKIKVVADLDNLYSGIQALLKYVDFPITSKDFPERLTGERDLLKSLPMIQRQFKCHMMVATLGHLGAIAWDGVGFLMCPGFRVKAIDTTGGGDVFHGAFVYCLARRFEMNESLEFSCAAAAINCTAPGARGRIATLKEIARLRKTGKRSQLAYTADALREAEKAAKAASAASVREKHRQRDTVGKDSIAAEINA